MKLYKLNYRENSDNPKANFWEIKDLILGNLNLIVGKNATGKSRTVNLIASFASLITEKMISNGEWNIEFKMDNGSSFHYELLLEGGFVKKEIIFLDGRKLLNRTLDKTEIFSNTEKKFITINPPSDKLVLHIRRDEKEYPFLENLFDWGNGVKWFDFGKVDPNNDEEIISTSRELSGKIAKLDSISRFFDEIGSNSQEKVREDLNSIGYGVEKIENRSLVTKTGIFKTLFFKEKGIDFPMHKSNLSKGMYAAFALLLMIQYIVDKNANKKDIVILVDDLCEGLDYDRSINFTKLLFNKLNKLGLQFIVASNDRFLMNAVNIEHWNILKRQNGLVKAFNYINNKETFDEFKFTGLNNFDFFASEYFEE